MMIMIPILMVIILAGGVWICLLYTSYPQGRLTDHRIGLTLYKLDDILNGNLDEVIDALITADRAAQLKETMESQE